jgi:hypothetical protein
MGMWLAAMGYLLLGAVLLISIALAVLIQKFAFTYLDALRNARSIKEIRRMVESWRKQEPLRRLPTQFADVQLDELIKAGRLDEALLLAGERVRLAHEHGLDERERFYREYVAQIKQCYPYIQPAPPDERAGT